MEYNSKDTLLSVSIYPISHWKKSIKNWVSYIDLAKKNGFNEIFSTMHLPEISLDDQIENLSHLSSVVKQKEMELTVDIGGDSINLILENHDLCRKVRDIGINFLRLDYGYKRSQIQDIIKKLNIHGFVLNASILNSEEIRKNIKFLLSIQDIAEVRACHNFYPRKETGITMKLLRSQYKYFNEHSIPVYVCIPSMTNPRGPLYDGLPTVEDHRYLSVERSALILLNNQCCDGFLVSDEYISEDEFNKIRAVIQKEPLSIKVTLAEEITEMEKEILLNGKHHIRYDSNDLVLRSQSSRQMSEFANKIPKRNSKERTAMCITIDNESYERYSGELQIVLKNLPQDNRVNVIGYIEEEERWKLQYYRQGYDYIFYVT